MTIKHRRFSHKVTLAVLFAGLNLLCLFCICHGHRSEHHARVNYAHVPPRGSGRPTSRTGRTPGSFTCAVSEHHDHEAANGLTRSIMRGSDHIATAALPAASLLRFALEGQSSAVSATDELAFGDAPRGPTRSRAPPAA